MEELEELEKLLRLAELDARLRQTKLEDMLPKPTPLEEALAAAKKGGAVRLSGKVDGRIEAGRQRAKKNRARKLKSARNRRWKKKWKLESLEKAVNNNYYEYFSRRWKNKGRKWLITEEEWLAYVQPMIPEGCVISLQRYDTQLATTLDNLLVYNSDGGSVLFDGKEHQLRVLGYSL